MLYWFCRVLRHSGVFHFIHSALTFNVRYINFSPSRLMRYLFPIYLLFLLLLHKTNHTHTRTTRNTSNAIFQEVGYHVLLHCTHTHCPTTHTPHNVNRSPDFQKHIIHKAVISPKTSTIIGIRTSFRVHSAIPTNLHAVPGSLLRMPSSLSPRYESIFRLAHPFPVALCMRFVQQTPASQDTTSNLPSLSLIAPSLCSHFTYSIIGISLECRSFHLL